ncbi:MAG: M48 family metallopeptidase, partial [Rhodothermales bacterium]|nr:M48 family metallopeptidase [Rhodothermales bacterium]
MPALLFGRCTCSSDSVNRGDLNVVPLGQEWQMGEQLAAEIARTQPLVDDPVLQEYVARLGAQLVEQTEMADRPWQFHVVADPSLNAFAIPGGHVYVNTGLIVAAESPAELAGVMAHEVAHGVARHGTERMTKVYGLSVVGSLVLGEDPGLLEQIAAQIIGSGAVARFSRKDETEADALGLDYLYEAGYPPEAMGTMF